MEIIHPNQVKIFDTTLRDGFQSPGVNVGPEDRFRVAQVLAAMRVDIIEAGFPISNLENFESVRAIAAGIYGPVICGLSRANAKDIDRSWEAIEPAKDKGGARIHTFIATSDIHMRDKLRMTREQVLDATRNAVRRAKGYTNDVEFSPEDASRSDSEFMMRVLLTAVDAGATTLNIPDTVGYAQPIEYADRIREVKRRVDEYIGIGIVTISAHCHNDLGLATANTLAAVMAGARQVEVTMNGIGERAGNTSLEEVVATLRTRSDFYSVDGQPLITRVNRRLFFAASELVEQVTGMNVQPNKAIVGINAFKHESGIHADGVSKNPLTYEIIDPEEYGDRSSRIVIGAESGHSAIVGRAEELGFKVEDRRGLTEKVKEYANKVRREVTDSELEKIFAEFNGETLNDTYILGNVETHGSDHQSSSKVHISINGQHQVVEATGKGPIEAAVQAIKNATGVKVDIGNFSGRSLDKGADAKAGVTITVKNGIEITAYSEDESVPLAAIKAYVEALNTIYRLRERHKIKK